MALARCYVSENQSLGGCTDGQAAAGGKNVGLIKLRQQVGN